MSTNHSTPLATVSDISGKVWVRSQDGSLHLLHKGDTVYEGEVIITEEGSNVKLKAMNGATLDVMQGKELALSVDLFQDRNAAGEEDSSSSAPPAPKPQSPDRATKENVQQSEDDSSGIHGYMRIGRISETVGDAPYTFLSYTGGYSSSLDGRSTGMDSFMEGRATTDERIQMSISPITFTYEQQGVVQREFDGAEGPVYYYVADTEPLLSPVSSEVNEDDLPAGNDEEAPKESLVVGGSLGVDTGGDSVDTYFINTSSLPSLTSEGEAVVYILSPDGHTITAQTTSGAPVFTITINNPTDTGGNQSYQFTLQGPVDHPDADGQNSQVLNFNVEVEDSTGDTASGSFSVTVVDDV
ncbi:MAG: retention module-containing protein, partial [Chlorobiaceae bacterium]|nr:retention module-containing protein [Chlorobiaceae bacterium]